MIDLPTQSPVPPASLDPAAQEAADRAAIEAKWVAFWNVYDAIVRTPREHLANELSAVAMSPVFDNVVKAAGEADAQGTDNYGTVTHRLSWQFPIDGSSTATIADCRDQSQTGTIKVATGEILSVGEPRSNMRGKFIKATDATWRPSEIFFMVDAPC